MIDYNEDITIQEGSLVVKETLTEIEGLQFLEDEKVTDNNISLNKIKFSIDGSTSFHLYATDPEKLQIVIKFFMENGADYLLGILKKNRLGFTPMHIAVRNDIEKSCELMLVALS